MTKKKKGIFSKLKEKFSKSNDEFEDEYELEGELEEEYEEEYLEEELSDSTGEIQVSKELLSKTSEGTNHNITFDSLEKDEDEIEDLLNHRDDALQASSTEIEQEDEEEEEFFPSEFKVSEQQKEELADLEAPIEDLSASNKTEEDFEQYEEDSQEEYDEDELYETIPPKQSVQQKFASFLSSIKNKIPKKAQNNIAFDGGTIDDHESTTNPKVNIEAIKNFSWP